MSTNFAKAFEKKEGGWGRGNLTAFPPRSTRYQNNIHQRSPISNTFPYQRRGFSNLDDFFNQRYGGRINVPTAISHSIENAVESDQKAEKSYHTFMLYDYNPNDNQRHHTVVRIPEPNISASPTNYPTTNDTVQHMEITTHGEWRKQYQNVTTCYPDNNGIRPLQGNLSLLDLPIVKVRIDLPIPNDISYAVDPDHLFTEAISKMGRAHKQKIEEYIIETIERTLAGQPPTEFSIQAAQNFFGEQQNRQPEERSFRYLQYDQQRFHNNNDPHTNPLALVMSSNNKTQFYMNYNNGFYAMNNPEGRNPECDFLGYPTIIPHFDGLQTGCYMWNPKDINIIRTKRPKVEITQRPDDMGYHVSLYDEFRIMILNVDTIKKTWVNANGEVHEVPTPIHEENLDDNQNGDDVQIIHHSENTAIETLREEITESEFRNYLKRGFINVMGSSGKTYQIFRDKQHIKVWYSGNVIEEICVSIRDYKIPPTDKLIAFKTMIETDETEFKKLGNIYPMTKAA